MPVTVKKREYEQSIDGTLYQWGLPTALTDGRATVAVQQKPYRRKQLPVDRDRDIRVVTVTHPDDGRTEELTITFAPAIVDDVPALWAAWEAAGELPDLSATDKPTEVLQHEQKMREEAAAAAKASAVVTPMKGVVVLARMMELMEKRFGGETLTDEEQAELAEAKELVGKVRKATRKA